MTSQAPTRTTEIAVTSRGGIPLDVAATLMRLVGAAYPSTRIGSATTGMRLIIDDADRVDEMDVFERAAELRVPADEYTADEVLTMVSGGQVEMSAPHALMALLVPLCESMFDGVDDAVNYLETTATRDGDARRWALSVSRSSHRTPRELRLAAERRAERAEARVAELEDRVRHLENTLAAADVDIP